MEEQSASRGRESPWKAGYRWARRPAGRSSPTPTPCSGADMANNVVLTAVRALAARGMSALRFNFRGVGRSTGTYGGGMEEADDVAAALAFLKSRTPGPHYVVGYSFGAAVAGRALLRWA